MNFKLHREIRLQLPMEVYREGRGRRCSERHSGRNAASLGLVDLLYFAVRSAYSLEYQQKVIQTYTVEYTSSIEACRYATVYV